MNRRSAVALAGALAVAVCAVAATGALVAADGAQHEPTPATDREVERQEENETSETDDGNGTDGPPLSPHATVGGGPSTGESVAGGDLNGDGTADVVVGIPFDDDAGNNAGAAAVFFGPVDPGETDVSAANVTVRGTAGGEWTGYDTAVADVNGDGYGDLIVSAPLRDNGYVYVFHGGPSMSETLRPSDADAVIAGGDDDEQFGIAVAPVPQEGADGLLVGDPRADGEGGEDAGAAYYFSPDSLSGDATSADADLRLGGEAAGDRAGWDVAAGDLTGNGTPDLVVGARDAGGSGAGAAYVAPAIAAGERSLADAEAVIRGAEGGNSAGHTVGVYRGNDSAGVIVGAPTADENGSSSGAVYVVPPENASLADAEPVYAGTAGDRAGWDATAGDVTCDGRADLLVGSPYADDKAGTAVMVPADGSDPVEILAGEDPGDYAGYRVALTVDATGDGNRDALVGAPDENVTNTTASATLLESGCAATADAVEENASDGGTDTETESDGTETDATDETAAAEAPSEGDPLSTLAPVGVVVGAAAVALGVVALWRRD
ncbi:hypothetical protein G9464_05825 [Halostella sp. JP-L12]|uniref:FG-GAP repeat protein n=1 Tax=Halostella TaxID=1843185 RepID=UPI000EF84408|nr:MULTISPECIES: FG-GAP repeat protein [Halostella]NHN47117.1 hypothetical protein [Halostella sp. JP-L12]